MMLWLRDGKEQIITNAWTAKSAGARGSVEIAYTWGADRREMFSGATGIGRVTLTMDMNGFSAFLKHGQDGVCDVREWCR